MIVLENVSKSYDGGKNLAVQTLNLRVPEGKLLALLGASGSGKTTTLKMINRLIEPTAGRILVGGKDVTIRDPVILRREIGYVVQGNVLFPHMNVADNIAVVPRLLGWPASRIEGRVRELLEKVHLPAEYATRWPDELSGGQQQRVGFARALAAGPRVMLLDEPFGALDPLVRDEVRNEFRRIQSDEGLTAVMVTHDVTEALLLADLVGVMRAGRLLQVGPPHELLSNPADEFVATTITTPERDARRLAGQLEALTARHCNGESR